MQIEHVQPKGDLGGGVGAQTVRCCPGFMNSTIRGCYRPVFTRTASEVSEIGFDGFFDRVESPHFIEATDLLSPG